MLSKITVEGGTPMSNAIKVAFATKNHEDIDAHFGGTKEFVVYDVSKEGYALSGVVQADTSEYDGDDKTEFKVRALVGVNMVYCETIGGTAAAKVIRAGIQPMKVQEPTTIASALEKLVQMLNGNPPPWIKRLLMKPRTQEIG